MSPITTTTTNTYSCTFAARFVTMRQVGVIMALSHASDAKDSFAERCAQARTMFVVTSRSAESIKRDVMFVARVDFKNAYKLEWNPTLKFDSSRGIAGCKEYVESVKRLTVLLFDYSNTLKPIADLSATEKICVIRNCLAQFILLVIAHQTVRNTENAHMILLPDGHYLHRDKSVLSNEHLEDKRYVLLDARVNCVKRNVIDQVIGPMRRLAISDVELVALKAIMCLDPNTAKIDARSATLLSVARDSVQNALYGHLSSSLPPTEATSRFGNILLLVASISKVGAAVTGLMQLSRDIIAGCDSILDDLFFHEDC